MSLRPFQLERYFARWEFEAPYLLCPSDCESLSIGELLALTDTPLDELTALRMGYTESQGDPALRETIAGFYPGLSAGQILVANAPEEAIFLTMMTLLDPGDRVVVQTPCYQSLFELARYRGCQVQAWPLVETEGGWQMDLERLAALLTPETKLLVINAPHNPTGYLPTSDEFETILGWAEAKGIWLFCDEMYRGLEYEAGQQLPPAGTRYERAISLWGMSKTFGLPGLRIGWLALQDGALMERLLSFKDYTTICSSAPGEFLSRLTLEKAETIIERNLGIIQNNLALLRDFMAGSDDFSWREPLAGPIAFVRLHRESAAAFCQTTVRGCGVLLAPATVFDFGDQHVRFGLGRRNFGEGLGVLAQYLKK